MLMSVNSILWPLYQTTGHIIVRYSSRHSKFFEECCSVCELFLDVLEAQFFSDASK